MWIYENKDWPNFTWNLEILANKLAEIRYSQGRLLGKMDQLGFELKQEATLTTITSDVVKSAVIEGEKLNENEVRSSVARHLNVNMFGLIPASRDVEGMVDMMFDATQNFKKPLTNERLFDWHAALFPAKRSGMYSIITGKWRLVEAGPMQIVSGPIGRQKIHFEAPNADKLEDEMAAFLAWFNGQKTIDPVLKAGIAHLWFLTIHPFEDGNGRIARAITDMVLARSDNQSERFYSLSTQIELERKDYYNKLEVQQRSTLDITDWLEWFLDCLGLAIFNAENNLSKILFKAKLWESINTSPVNERQRLIINKMLEENFQGHINTSKYAKLTKCSNDTALRDIQDLKSRKVLIQNPGGGRSTSYRLLDRSK